MCIFDGLLTKLWATIMNKIILSALLLILSSALYAHDFSTPEQAVESYIKAVKTGSGEHITMAFDETAMIKYYDDNSKLNNYSRDEFAKLVNTGNQWDAEIKITNMLRTENAANATVEFTWGENGEHGYVDYLNLLNNGTSWHITSKVAQYVKRK